MKKIVVSIVLPDNGGIVFTGPLLPSGSTTKAASASYSYDYPKQRMYISAGQDPLEVGQTLLAMLADLQLSEARMQPAAAPEPDIPF